MRTLERDSLEVVNFAEAHTGPSLGEVAFAGSVQVEVIHVAADDQVLIPPTDTSQPPDTRGFPDLDDPVAVIYQWKKLRGGHWHWPHQNRAPDNDTPPSDA